LSILRLIACTFIWPTVAGEAMVITAAQLGYMLDHPC
jgi:hypothetical protein